MTPKTLDKYIAALKKKAAAAGMTQAEYEAELSHMMDEMAQQYLDNKITSAEYSKVSKQIDNAKKGMALQGKQASQGMTQAEHMQIWQGLKKKQQAGLITQSEYFALTDKLDDLYQKKTPFGQAQKLIGTDPGTAATDEAVIKLEKEFRKIYGAAGKEIKKELDDFLKKYGPEMKELEMKFIDGTIDEAELKHLKMLTLQKGILNQKADQIAGVMTNANQKALAMVNGEQLNVFAQNANWQSYQLTQDTKMNLSFSVYDENTVQKLIKDKPELLPRKEVNGKKDKAWNRKIIAGAVAQGVIQGDSIPKLARRIAMQTGETNMKAMTRYARTAMTGAQNGGRMEMLHKAQGMGIKVKKTWLATLDSRTRDSHQHLDGKTIGVDDKFDNGLMYPGDPGGAPAEVYNCRCTLIYDYEGFPNDPTADQRYDQESGQLIQDMSYDEWKAAKEGSQLNDLNAAKYQLAEAQKAVIQAGVKEDKVYEGLWKDPVTLADYPAKKAGIPAKLDYYDTEIEKYKQAQAAGSSWATDEKIKELEKKRKLLKEFDKRGALIEKRDKALQAVQGIYTNVGNGKAASAPAVAKKAAKKAKKAAAASGGTSAGAGSAGAPTASLAAAGAKKTPFGPEAYTQERKDNALWTSDKKKVDGMMRDRTGEVWSNATQAEREAIYEYTQSYSKFNEPLRGIEYGTNRFLGVGNTDLNPRQNGKVLNAMTDIIDKCSYDHDMWLQRGCGYGGMDKFFNVSPDLLRNGSQRQLEQALLGKTVTEYGFMSMGSAKGQGFHGNIMLNIYAPAGTKMMYVEPFSAYSGGYDHLGWDGKSKQGHFGGEFETIMQQGTQFRVTKVNRSGSQIYVDIEVIGQDHQQRWKR